jgi:integrase
MPRKKTATGRRDNRTGAIYKDGKGYRVQIQTNIDPADGKPILKKARAKDHDEAVEKLARLQALYRTRTLAAPSDMTLAKYVEEWLEENVKPTKALKTYEQRKWVLETHVIPTLGKKKLDAVTRRDVQTLIATLAKQPVKPRSKPDKKQPIPDYEGKPGPKPTKKVEEPKPETPPRLLGRRTLEVVVAVLHALYAEAIRNSLAGSNPAADIPLPSIQQKTPEFLTPEEVTALVGKLTNSPIRQLVLFMLSTGTRIGEATGVRWQDIDLTKGFVRITGQLQRIDGELQYRPVTKSNRDRTLTLSPWLNTELQQMRSKQLLDEHKDPEGIAFLNSFGRRFDGKYVYSELAACCDAAKIKRVSPHKLRHTAATLALMDTGDIHAVQKLLGHKQAALTTNLYGHATAERLRPAMDALSKLIQPAEPAAEK